MWLKPFHLSDFLDKEIEKVSGFEVSNLQIET